MTINISKRFQRLAPGAGRKQPVFSRVKEWPKMARKFGEWPQCGACQHHGFIFVVLWWGGDTARDVIPLSWITRWEKCSPRLEPMFHKVSQWAKMELRNRVQHLGHQRSHLSAWIDAMVSGGMARPYRFKQRKCRDAVVEMKPHRKCSRNSTRGHIVSEDVEFNRWRRYPSALSVSKTPKATFSLIALELVVTGYWTWNANRFPQLLGHSLTLWRKRSHSQTLKEILPLQRNPLGLTISEFSKNLTCQCGVD